MEVQVRGLYRIYLSTSTADQRNGMGGSNYERGKPLFRFLGRVPVARDADIDRAIGCAPCIEDGAATERSPWKYSSKAVA